LIGCGEGEDEVIERRLTVLSHKLGHDAQTTDLDFDRPVLDIIFHRRNEHSTTLLKQGRWGYRQLRIICRSPSMS
jgi:hypothetical protein